MSSFLISPLILGVIGYGFERSGAAGLISDAPIPITEMEIMNAEDHLMNPILTLNTNDISKQNNFEKSKEVDLFNVPEGIPVQIFVDEAIRGIMPGQRTIPK